MAVGTRRLAPERFDRLVGGEQGTQVVDGATVAVGEDDTGPPGEEAGPVVVDPLAGGTQTGLRVARLRVARRVAEVVQQHDRVRREVERLHVRLAVVLVLVVGELPVAVQVGVQAHAVLGRVLRVVGVWARPTVAVAEVDEDRRSDRRRLYPRPRRVRAVDLDDVRGVLDRLGVRGVGVLAVRRRRAVGRTDHDDDLRGRARRRGVGSRGVPERRERTGEREHGDGKGTTHWGSTSSGVTDLRSVTANDERLHRSKVRCGLAPSEH